MKFVNFFENFKNILFFQKNIDISIEMIDSKINSYLCILNLFSLKKHSFSVKIKFTQFFLNFF